MAAGNYTAFNALVDIIVSPAKALDEVRQHTSWLWWPLLISIVLACAGLSYYYSWVDFPWLVDETIASLPAESRAEAADGVRTFMSPTSSIITSVVAIVLMTFVIYAIQSVYLHLVNKLATNEEVRYGQWFSFSAWTAFPNVVGALAMFVVILLADNNRLTQSDLSPFSMNALLIHAEMGEPWFTWGSSLSLINFWMLALMTIGFARWTGSSIIKSAIIVTLPWLLIFGIWAAMI
jgi:hypothetical protein